MADASKAGVVEKIIPKVKADDDEEEEEEEEVVDPQEVLREECKKKPEVAKMERRLQKCTARVNADPNTEEICDEEMLDFMHALDHCAAHSLFSKLK